MSSSKFEEFLSKVMSKVKSKEAHNKIKKELANHLQELSQSYKKRGFSQEDADEKAIQEMGNPFTIGENLNPLHKPKMDWVLIVLFVLFAGISFLPLVEGIPQLSISGTYIMGRQVIWYSLTVLVLIGFLFFDYQKLKIGWKYFYAIGLLILLYLHLFGYMKKWVLLPGLTVDGTMLSLFFFFLAWAGIFNKMNEFHSWKKQGLLFVLFWTPTLLYMMVPDFMVSIIYFFCILGMLVFARIHKKLAVNLALTNLLAGIIFIIMFYMTSRQSYLFTRLSAFINPTADPNGAGYLYIAVRNVLSEAGWFGNGLYNDLNSQLLPEAHTDFAFPFLVYSLGWAFGIFLCLIILIFISRISKNAFKTKDLYGRLIVIGGATLFAVPTTWSILMGFGVLPIMRVSLPFISYGGSGIVFYGAVLGLILSVYRRKDLVEPMIEDEIKS
ncbi:FtsW/RodA/SpoVE family cell cycle protein [Bacillus sp. FJAT-27245]|uniref:FtsW/RodA/SpoVE family cell cycle protein n=1 Tax=Bacillus sp. FJAT-27245 TaxID=1684144 RepID=UPI0006A7BF12|nr:FtsW/RodA/SpoVE family cell cycle protein [Bacillus sp. FJAT-27245]